MSKKEELLKSYNLSPQDTGSSAAQFVLLKARTDLIIKHLRMNRKDVPAKRSMLKKLARQKRILNYLKRQDYHLYNVINDSLRQEKKNTKVS